MSAYHPDGPHAAARPTLTAEDLDLYAAKFFPNASPADRLAMVRKLLGGTGDSPVLFGDSPNSTDH
jgi:hypothetical protein